MKVDNIKNQLPDGIKQGFKVQGSGEVHQNIYVCDPYGNYLYSKIKFDSTKFSVRRLGWQAGFTDTNGKNTKELYIAFGITSGTQFLSFLFDTDARFSAKDHFEEYLIGVKGVKSSSYSRRQRINPNPVINSLRKDVTGMSERIKALSIFQYQIAGEFNLRGLGAVSGMSRTDPQTIKILISSYFLNLHSDDIKYTSAKFSTMLSKLEPIATSIFPNDWFRSLARFTINSEGETKYNSLAKLDFYKNWLSVIKKDLESGNPTGYFSGFEDLKSMTFTSNFDDTANHELIKLMDIALIEAWGYSAFISLLSGILSISKDNNGVIKIKL